MSDTASHAVGNSSFFRTVTSWFAVLSAFFSLFAALSGRAALLPGVWAGFAWISLNLFFLEKLLRWSTGGGGDKKKIYLACFVKFPVLYLAGFFLVLTPWVTLSGVFAAFTLFFAAFGALKLKSAVLKQRGN